MNKDNYFVACRDKVFSEKTRKYLISRIQESSQSRDLTVPPNCDGFGRIHHFIRKNSANWISDPLPIDPACKSLGLPYRDIVETQVFQIAVCNVKCWYCFVSESLKCADEKNAKWYSAEELLQLYLKEQNQALIIDLSGGNPELVPEWTLDMMRAIEKMGLKDKVYLWSDDTLTTDYIFKYLNSNELAYLCSYPHYGKVGCFKGFDVESFCLNSGLSEEYFEYQFKIFKRQFELGLDLYGYVTFTCKTVDHIAEKMKVFVDRLQSIHVLLPLRVIPLKIEIYTPVLSRKIKEQDKYIENQFVAIEHWKNELCKRYTEEQLSKRICDVNIRQ